MSNTTPEDALRECYNVFAKVASREPVSTEFGRTLGLLSVLVHHFSEDGTTVEEDTLLFHAGIKDSIEGFTKGGHGPITITRCHSGGLLATGSPEQLLRYAEDYGKEVEIAGMGEVRIETLTPAQSQELRFFQEIPKDAYRSLPKWAQIQLREEWDSRKPKEA